MAYTDQWPVTPEATPPDSELANLLANNIRQLEREIRERMDDVFTDASGTWAASGPASPVVVSPALTGKVTGKQLAFHHTLFQPSELIGSDSLPVVTRTALYTQGYGGADAISLWAPLILPVGCNIAIVYFLVNRNGAGNVTCKLRYVSNDAVPVANDLATVSTTVNGVSLISSAVGHVVSASNTYFLEVSVLAGVLSRLYLARVNYDTPDSRNNY